MNCVHTIWLEGLPFQQVGRGVRDPELLTQGEALLQSVRLVALQKREDAPRLKAAHQAHVRLRQLSSEVGVRSTVANTKTAPTHKSAGSLLPPNLSG